MEGHVKKSWQFQVCYSGFLRCRQVVARDSYKWVSYKKVVSGWCEWWWIYFGWWWVVVDIFWLVVGGGGWWGVVVDIFWLVVDCSGWWHNLV